MAIPMCHRGCLRQPLLSRRHSARNRVHDRGRGDACEVRRRRPQSHDRWPQGRAYGTFRLLVNYANRVLGKPPQDLSFEDIDADFIGDFLNHLEHERGNGVRTCNARLVAIRSLFAYVALHEPHPAALAQRVLAIPTKRHARREVDFLDRDESEALLRSPDRSDWVGRRDHTLLLVALQTGMRSSEIITLCRDSIAALRAWLKERGGKPNDRVFRNQRGRPLTHESLTYLLARNLAVAHAACPSLKEKKGYAPYPAPQRRHGIASQRR